jgi:hypothetical protein
MGITDTHASTVQDDPGLTAEDDAIFAAVLAESQSNQNLPASAAQTILASGPAAANNPQQTDSWRTRNTRRTMAMMQAQLDSMRALLAQNPTDATSRAMLTQATSDLEREHADIEAGFSLFMDDDDNDEDDDEDGDLGVANDVTRRRRAVLARAGIANFERDRYTRRSDRPRMMRASSSTRSTPEPAARQESFDRTAAFVYTIEKSETGSDVWPDMRDPAKMPARFRPVDLSSKGSNSAPNKKAAPKTPIIKDKPTSEDDSTKIVWPMNQLPSEIYYLIAESLSRDDIKALRLACKEMEHHLSCILFKTVVVPFNTEIYGMLLGLSQPKKVDVKGKGKATAPKSDGLEFWKNAKDEDIYTGHGVDVFRSFGPRMKRFGMSFEVDEDVLANPPLKGTREDHKSYWGVYQWPYPEYKRFDQVAGLEDAADETPKMKTAFSFLTEVQELGLSLDAGLGWLNGPDRSIRSRVLGEQRPVFGKSHPIQDRKQEARQWLWSYLQNWAIGTQCDLKQCSITAQQLPDTSLAKDLMVAVMYSPVTPYLDLQEIIDPIAKTLPIMQMNVEALLQSNLVDGLRHPENNGAGSANATAVDSNGQAGLLLVRQDKECSDAERLDAYPIIPMELTKLQKEWLLETEWAQRAFLSSWLIAVVDNRLTFQNVHSINFARISSRFLLSLCREDLWRALPQLETVALNVIPDCRDVIKDNAGFVDTPRVPTVTAVWMLQKLVSEMFALRPAIKTLDVGWADGGEHAQGLLARNKHVMPAFVLPAEWVGSAENMTDKNLLEQRMLRLPHVKHLTMRNCWISPHALTHLIKEHTGLEHLCLESVSLIAEPILNQGANPQQIVAMAQQLQGPLMPAQPPNPNQGPAWNAQAHATFMQALQNANNQNVAAGGAAIPAQAQVPPYHDWLNPRTGSWPYILSAISPGLTLTASGSTTAPTTLPSTIPHHSLRTLEFRSAGYCRLNNPRLDESAVPPSTAGVGSIWFYKRHAALTKVMLPQRGGIMAEIVPHIGTNEEQALHLGFGLETGWPEDWRENAEAPTFDGCLFGGAGRFTGVIERSSRVEVQEE